MAQTLTSGNSVGNRLPDETTFAGGDGTIGADDTIIAQEAPLRTLAAFHIGDFVVAKAQELQQYIPAQLGHLAVVR